MGVYVPYTWADGSIGNTPITAANLNHIEGGVAANDVTNPASQAALASAPLWKPTTAYALGQVVVSPNNDVVSAIAAHTSGATFTAANWNLSVTFAPRRDFDVKSYSAVGDGITDDTTAIQNAITAMAAANGRLVFPPGTYLSNGQTFTGLSNFAVDMQGTILRKASSATVPLLDFDTCTDVVVGTLRTPGRDDAAEGGGPLQCDRQVALEYTRQDGVGERSQLSGPGRLGNSRDNMRNVGKPYAGRVVRARTHRVAAHPFAQGVEAPQRPGETACRSVRPELGEC
jgi:hypothetical protein